MALNVLIFLLFLKFLENYKYCWLELGRVLFSDLAGTCGKMGKITVFRRIARIRLGQ